MPTMRRRAGPAVAVVLLGVAIALPFLNSDPVAVSQFAVIVLDVLAIIGLNIAAGYTGLLTLGVGALVGVGAYAAALMEVDFGLPAWLAVITGTAVATAGGLLILAPSLRLGRAAYAMLSLYVATAFASAGTILPLQRLLHADGLNNIAALIPLSSVNNDDVTQAMVIYFVVLAVAVIALLLGARLVTSHWGRALIMVRDDDVVAASLGVSPVRARILALFACSLCASLSGALFASTGPSCVNTCNLSVDTFSLTLSIFLFSALVVGGRATILGPVVGGVTIGVFYVLLAGSFSGTTTVGQLIGAGAVYGALLLVVAVLLPGGVWGSVQRLFSAQVIAVSDESAPERPSLPSLPGAAHDSLEVSAITVRYGGTTAVDAVSLTCPRGHVHALIGANGSGKTSLLNAISGLVTPASGTLMLGDRRLDAMAPFRRARRGISRTFQTPRIAGSLSVLDNVVMGGFARHPSGLLGLYLMPWRHRAESRRLRQEALHLLRIVGLGSRATAAAGTLTHGQRRLLEVARALLAQPRLLLLDEPAAGLAAEELNELAAIILAARDAGCAVILVEHNLAFVRRVAATATALDRGAVLADGAVEVVLATDSVITSFVGERVA